MTGHPRRGLKSVLRHLATVRPLESSLSRGRRTDDRDAHRHGARRHCPSRIRRDPPGGSLVGRAGRHRGRIHGLHRLFALFEPPLGTAVPRADRDRRLLVAVLLAAHRAGFPADLVLARDPHPVDPARLPDDLLLLPQGLLPRLFRRSAGLRRRGADRPSPLSRWSGTSRSSSRTCIGSSSTWR